VGSIEPDFMKLRFMGKSNVHHVYVMVDVSDLEDVSSIKRRLEVVCIGIRGFFGIVISLVVPLFVFLTGINTHGIVSCFNGRTVVSDTA
jgi:hypothetical protein